MVSWACAVYIEHEDTMFRNRVCEHACSSEHLLVYRGAIVGRLSGMNAAQKAANMHLVDVVNQLQLDLEWARGVHNR